MATLISGGLVGEDIEDILDASPIGIDDYVDGNIPDGPGGPTSPPILGREDTRTIWFESLDGLTILPLNVDVDRILTGGATGLQMPPLDVVTIKTPGPDGGSTVHEVNVLEREIFLPLKFASEQSHDDFLTKLDEFRTLISTGMWSVQPGTTGLFRLGVSSSRGTRLIDVTYREGWSGSWGGTESGTRWEKIGLSLLAAEAYFHDRDYTSFTFQVADGEVFLSSTDDNGWPRALSPSTVIGNGMPMQVRGTVPAWIEMIVDGPASLASVTFPGTDIRMTSTIPDASELVLITEPRRRSARLDGAVAWSKIAMTSTFAPLMPGPNLMNVALDTSGEGTALTVRWRERYLSAF
ncbi:phage distal tail protein [Microbacterium sp. M1A1_1b]